MNNWDATTDFLVVGSGAAGMTAAITAHDLGGNVLIIEKSTVYGGSTAMSGGVAWIPGNHHMDEVGITDSIDEAITYVKHRIGRDADEERLRAYIDNAPKMLHYLEERTRVKFYALGDYPDDYSETPGGKLGGRSVKAEPFDGLQLGDEFDRLRMPHPQELMMGRFMLTEPEAQQAAQGGIGAKIMMAKKMAAYAINIPARRKTNRSTRLTLGNALVARLRASLLDRGVPLWLNTTAKELIVEDGRIIGLAAVRHGVEMRIQARKGVLLAAGGYERNIDLRKEHQHTPISDHWSSANPDNTGDGIRMARDAGAAVDQMEHAWWVPTVVVPGEPYAYALAAEKSLPGSIIVNKAGKRFTNEAAPYGEVVKAMYENNKEDSPSIPAYLIFDGRFREKYPAGPLLPGSIQADEDLPLHLQQHFLMRASTIPGIALLLDIDPMVMIDTVAKFNGFALAGEDRDFHRGESAYDRYYGDESVVPNPNLGPLSEPPYYAMEVVPGDWGTSGGLKTGLHGEVLDGKGNAIGGLYAAGNSMASIMSSVYPGAGGTIGPAMVFGYLAAFEALKGNSG
jgi:3-oxosteroid 1-dehydrogenase